MAKKKTASRRTAGHKKRSKKTSKKTRAKVAKKITITAATIMKRVCRSKHVPVSLRKFC